MRKGLTLIFLAVLLGSCNIGDSIQDNIDHYKRLSRDEDIKEESYSKDTNTLEGMRFLIANNPDRSMSVAGTNFDERYEKLVKFLNAEGYKIVVNDKFNGVATIIAKVNKPMPNMRYIAVEMEQNKRLKQTDYDFVYGNNEYLAQKLYADYKKSLEKPKKPNENADKSEVKTSS